MTQCKLYTRAAAAAVAVNIEVADGADAVFTDTGSIYRHTASSVSQPAPYLLLRQPRRSPQLKLT